MRVVDSLAALTGKEKTGGSVVALGYFDGIHVGHRAVLDYAVEQASRRNCLPAVFTFRNQEQESSPRFKGGAPILMTQEQKLEVFAQLGLQFCLCPSFEEVMDMEPELFFGSVLLHGLGAVELCCGQDFRFGKGARGDVAMLETLCHEHRIHLHILPKVTLEGMPVSSTKIRELIAQGDVDQAAKWMGRPFLLDSVVVKGNQLGRTIGSPTINQTFPPRYMVPKYGVYATEVTVDGKRYGGMTNVGVKPTVGPLGSDVPLCETYILDYKGDLYGKTVRVAFLRFLRPERKFASLEELKSQITKDIFQASQMMHVEYKERPEGR